MGNNVRHLKGASVLESIAEVTVAVRRLHSAGVDEISVKIQCKALDKVGLVWLV